MSPTLIYQWSQGKLFSKGACSSLGYEWILFRSRGEPNGAFFKHVEANAEVILKRQAEQQTGRKGEGWLVGPNYMSDKGLTLLSLTEEPRKLSSLKKVEAPGRWMVTFILKDRNCHSIAVDSFFMQIFDPNKGVYQCSTRQQLSELLHKLLVSYGTDKTAPLVFENYLLLPSRRT